jgi:prepilin signal peptidase PulO-like enzyme (type II secretory pathway)
MQVGFVVLMFVLGAAIGSFLCCQVRRLELISTKKQHLGPRSVCMKCKKKLSWYENIPIISWIILGGKCKKCKAKIGLGELLSELGMATAFACVASTININTNFVQDWFVFFATLIFVSTLGFLAIYDGIYGELPNFALYLAIFFGITVWLAARWGDITCEMGIDALYSIAILGGIYLFLTLISKGKWVGDGDWILGTAIAIALGKPWFALVALFLSNLIACIVMYPFVKNKSKKQIYFGPFLVIAYVITITFSGFIESMVI